MHVWLLFEYFCQKYPHILRMYFQIFLNNLEIFAFYGWKHRFSPAWEKKLFMKESQAGGAAFKHSESSKVQNFCDFSPEKVNGWSWCHLVTFFTLNPNMPVCQPHSAANRLSDRVQKITKNQKNLCCRVFTKKVT